MISKFEVDDALPFFKLLNEIDTSLQKLLIGNQKCDALDNGHDPYVSTMLRGRHKNIHINLHTPLPTPIFCFWIPQENRIPKKIRPILHILKPTSNRSPYIFTLVQKVKHRVNKIQVILIEAILCQDSASYFIWKWRVLLART